MISKSGIDFSASCSAGLIYGLVSVSSCYNSAFSSVERSDTASNLETVRNPRRIKTKKIMSRVRSMYGTLVATASGNNFTGYPALVVIVVTFKLSGLQRWWETYPRKNPPNPKPEMMIPDARPFLPGRCVHAANRADEYIKPFAMPRPIPKRNINPVGFEKYEQTKTVDTWTIPPIARTLNAFEKSQVKCLHFRVNSGAQVHPDWEDESRYHHNIRLREIKLFNVNVVTKHFEVASYVC
jgi:hypothetical protein